MIYRVLWTPDAEARLERYLKASVEPAELVASAREIDRSFLTSPEDFGESRYEKMRIGFVFPLGVQFEVMDDARTVIVHDVWRIDEK